MCKGPVAGEPTEVIKGQEGRQSDQSKESEARFGWGGAVRARQMFIFVLKAMETTDRS